MTYTTFSPLLARLSETKQSWYFFSASRYYTQRVESVHDNDDDDEREVGKIYLFHCLNSLHTHWMSTRFHVDLMKAKKQVCLLPPFHAEAKVSHTDPTCQFHTNWLHIQRAKSSPLTHWAIRKMYEELMSRHKTTSGNKLDKSSRNVTQKMKKQQNINRNPFFWLNSNIGVLDETPTFLLFHRLGGRVNVFNLSGGLVTSELNWFWRTSILRLSPPSNSHFSLLFRFDTHYMYYIQTQT